jgi:hypothetical protein
MWFRNPRRMALAMAFCLCLGLMLAAGLPARAAPGDWQWQSPYPVNGELAGVAYGKGLYVAVGSAGMLLTSSDGAHWTYQASGTLANLQGVTYGGGRFVAVGGVDRRKAGGAIAGAILTSADGVSWVALEGQGDTMIRAVAYGDGRYVAVGDGGALLTSADATAWTRQVWGEAFHPDFLAVAYGAGRFVAAGGAVLYSADGTQWSVPAEAAHGTAIAFDGERFVAAGGTLSGFNEPMISTSADGNTWSPLIHRAPQGVPGSDARWDGIAHAQGIYIAVGSSSQGQVLSAVEPINSWEYASPGSGGRLKAIIYAGGQYVAVGADILTSADGVDWTLHTPAAQLPPLDGVVYGGGRFVISTEAGETLTSTDGATWEKHPRPGGWLFRDMAYGAGLFVAIDHQNTLLTSPDGAAWTPRQSGGETNLLGVLYGGGQFVVLGSGGTMLTSPDGITWAPHATGTAAVVRRAAYGGSRYVAVGGGGGAVLTSPDGVTWTEGSTGVDTFMYDIAYGNGLFVAVGYQALLTSPDGVTWTRIPAGDRWYPFGVAYGGGRFVAVGGSDGVNGIVFSSADGVNWSAEPLTWVELASVAYGAGRFVAVGAGGTILTHQVADPGCGERFPDLPADHPACRAIERLAARGVVNGNPDGRFRPDEAVTRAEFTKMLVLAAAVPPRPEAPSGFADAEEHWAAQRGYIQAAVALGSVNGFPDATFRPDRTATRAEISKMAGAAAGLNPGGSAPYDDVAAGDWYAGWVAADAEARLVGQQAPTALWPGPAFGGEWPATRAEAAVLLDNLLAVRR